MGSIDYEFEYGEPTYYIEEEDKYPCRTLDEYNFYLGYIDISEMKSKVRECELKHKASYHIECSDDCPFWKYWHK